LAYKINLNRFWSTKLQYSWSPELIVGAQPALQTKPAIRDTILVLSCSVYCPIERGFLALCLKKHAGERLPRRICNFPARCYQEHPQALLYAFRPSKTK
jgi:hypothetical protein